MAKKGNDRRIMCSWNASDAPADAGPSESKALGTKWDKSNITYRIDSYPENSPLSRKDVDKTYDKAFQLWSCVSPLQFTRTNDKADIVITFESGCHGDGNCFDGRGGVLAHAFGPPAKSGKQDIGGNIHFDEDEIWTVNGTGGTDLLAVAVHEIGHSLGLGHSKVKDAIMYPCYNGYKKTLKLHDDDVKGIQRLYRRH